jgi:hypothetical protein
LQISNIENIRQWGEAAVYKLKPQREAKQPELESLRAAQAVMDATLKSMTFEYGSWSCILYIYRSRLL